MALIYFLKHIFFFYATASKTIYCPDCGENVLGDDYCANCWIAIPKRWDVYRPPHSYRIETSQTGNSMQRKLNAMQRKIKAMITETADCFYGDSLLATRWSLFTALVAVALINTPFESVTNTLATQPLVNFMFNIMQNDGVSFVHNRFTDVGALMSGGALGGVAGIVRQLSVVALSTTLVQSLLRR